MSKVKTAKRAVIGGGILGLAVLIAWLMNQLPDLGQSDQEHQASLSSNVSFTAQSQVEPSTAATVPQDAVVVIVAEDSLYVRMTDASEQKIELPELLSYIKTATGDESGFRVRILKRESARAAVVDRLDAELKKAGIPIDAIHRQYELLPDEK